MKEFEPIKLDKETTDGTVRNLDALYQLFPQRNHRRNGAQSRCTLSVVPIVFYGGAGCSKWRYASSSRLGQAARAAW